jgi:DNA-binding CsgD family transcriptional regulator
MLVEWSGDLHAGKTCFAVLHEQAVERGDEHALPFILFHVARIELLLGEWEAAREHAREADQTAVESGQVSERTYSQAIIALVDAHLGRVDDARARIEEALPQSEVMGVAPAEIELRAMRGFLELSCGEWEEADRSLEHARMRAETFGLNEPSLFRFHGDAIEAKLALGLVEDARERVAELARLAEKLDRAILRSTAGRCRGLLSAAEGDFAGAYAALDAALELHPMAAQPFEEARTLLALGSIQRRDRKKQATRDSLGRALELFDGLGARLWADRARAELARVGGRPSTGALTPTEARIADLIAAGRTYRETADMLFISPKTVQWNLSKIYRKLGVRSRAELAARMRGADESPPTPADRPAGS